MTVPLMERLDVEVETLDSLFGIDAARLPEPADEFRERGAELRLAWAAAADWRRRSTCCARATARRRTPHLAVPRSSPAWPPGSGSAGASRAQWWSSPVPAATARSAANVAPCARVRLRTNAMPLARRRCGGTAGVRRERRRAAADPGRRDAAAPRTRRRRRLRCDRTVPGPATAGARATPPVMPPPWRQRFRERRRRWPRAERRP